MPQPHTNPDLSALEAQWWKDWWAADWSWDGLKLKSLKKVIDNGSEFLFFARDEAQVAGDLTLADVWQAESSHLIPEPGTTRQWTRLHCPYFFADGSPSPKMSWTEEQWREATNAIRSWKFKNELPQHVFLNGAVIRSLPMFVHDEDKLLRLWMDQANTSKGGSGFHTLNSFRSISGLNAWFSGSFFLDGSNLDLRWLRFDRSVFVGNTQISGCIKGGASFAEASFLGPFLLWGAMRFTAEDSDTTEFGDYTITGLDTDFSGACFAAKADFSEATFSGHANFEGACFAGPADFFGVRFLNRALFDTVRCLEEIGFYKAAFVRRLTVNDAEFFGRVNLEGATDGDPIAQSPQTLRLRANDDQKGLTGTLDAAHGPSERSFKSLPKLHARRTVFHEDANLSNRDLLSPSTLRQAVFQERARFHGSDLHANVNFHGARFRDALSYRPGATPKYPDDLLRLRFLSQTETSDFRVWKKDYVKARIAARQTDFTPDGYFESLEASFRTLKQMMEDRRDRAREGEFFNLELRARRKRGDVPWWERIASYIYWSISDYGNSIFRPLAVLLVLYVTLSLTYFAMGDHENLLAPAVRIDTAHLYSAFGFAWNNVFSPFSVLDPQRFSGGDAWAHDLVFSPDAGFNFRIKVLATLQSLLSLTLAFLAGLAGRRRFQIN